MSSLRSTSAPGRPRGRDEFAYEETKGEGPRPGGVRFSAATWRSEEPKISEACKTFMAYAAARSATDRHASQADADRAARVGILCARAAMRAVNGARPATGDAAEALEALPDGSLATKCFGRSFLRDPEVAAAVRAAPAQPGLAGEDRVFIEDFLRSACDDDDDLTWSPDYKQTLARRHEQRKEQAADRLANREPVFLDPALAAEAAAVHRAVVDASTGGDRPLPALPRL